jgi:glycosyltransferase involved in cell wall biosynthesis
MYRSTQDFEAACSDNGWRSTLFSFDLVPQTGDTTSVHYSVSPLPVLRHCHFSAAAHSNEFRSSVRQADCVVVHGTLTYPTMIAARLARHSEIPVITIPHGGLDPWAFSYRALRKRLWLSIFNGEYFSEPNHVVFATQREQEKARRFVRNCASEVINWPVPGPPDYEKAQAETRLRQRLNLPSDAKILLYCGRIHPQKRPLETARAFLGANLSDWVLLLVGPFSSEVSREQIAEFCKSSQGKCLFTGPQFGEDLAECYRGSNALILLSYRENFGYTVAEAASYGLPVLVSSEVDLSVEIARSRAGAVCTDSSEEGFGKAIVTFCNLPSESLDDMGKQGRRWAAERLSPGTFSQAMTRTIISLVSARNRQINYQN